MSSDKDSSSFNSNHNNSSSPRPITPREGALTPLPRPSPLQSPPGFGSHRSAFTHFPQGMAGAIPVGGSGVSGVVDLAGSPIGSKRGRPEKEAVVGEGSEENCKKCSIYGKMFASEKAIFRHMRLHRDTGWREAHPPPTFNAEEEFADVPGVNLPLAAPQVRAEGVEEGGAATEAATAAEREAEEAAVAAVERRRGIRIDLNVDVTTEGPDDAPKA